MGCRRAGVAALTNRELFDFVVDPNITADNEEAALQALHDVAARSDPCSHFSFIARLLPEHAFE